MAISIALAGEPSASTITTVGAGGLLATTTMSCEKDDPSAIDRSTDNPANKADFMKDVNSAILDNGTAKLTFEAVWVPSVNGKGGNYKLKPIPVIDFTRVKGLLEVDAKLCNIPLDKMGLKFTVAKEGGSFPIGYAIPYSYISSKSGEQTMKFEDYTKFISEGSEAKPDVLFSKRNIGFLRISSLSDLRVKSEVLTQYHTINPYTFGN